eukprot:gnl/Chilomastix_cuspidata/3685.p1 GENE.gnl/Chilomastix_cuspidata/3685~~gnl/Chilomastix_cuspidata/3685.p1  ORF type:complete len:635 (+),score=273.70 gnl/Chilomastix_cuspidata/3685:99-1907(+)
MAQQSNEELHRIALYINGLKDEEISVRLEASEKLPEIAAYLGPERTRKELIPYVIDEPDPVNDVVMSIADQLVVLSDFVGGTEYLDEIARGLTNFYFCSDSVTFRRHVGDALVRLLSKMNSERASAAVLPFVQQKMGAVWVTNIAPAVQLLALVYEFVAGTRAGAECLEQVFAFADHGIVCVRVEVAKALVEVAPALDERVLVERLVPIALKLATDAKAAVASVGIVLAGRGAQLLAELDRRAEARKLLDCCIESCAADELPWRVRSASASVVPAVAIAAELLAPGRADEFEAFFGELLKDPRSEVRHIAVDQIPKVLEEAEKFSDATRRNVAAACVAAVLVAARDQFANIRAFAVFLLTVLAERDLGAGRADDLRAVLLALAGDDGADVRLAVALHLRTLVQAPFMKDAPRAFLQAAEQLLGDESWRVRQAALRTVAAVGIRAGASAFTQTHLPLVAARVSDGAAAVREEALQLLFEAGGGFGADWFERHALAVLEDLLDKCNEATRVSIAAAARIAVEAFSADAALAIAEPLLSRLLGDSCVNVQIASAESAAVVAATSRDAAARRALVGLLKGNLDSDDPDVVFSALSALDALGALTDE